MKDCVPLQGPDSIISIAWLGGSVLLMPPALGGKGRKGDNDSRSDDVALEVRAKENKTKVEK
jgi:hypothetical protein